MGKSVSATLVVFYAKPEVNVKFVKKGSLWTLHLANAFIVMVARVAIMRTLRYATVVSHHKYLIQIILPALMWAVLTQIASNAILATSVLLVKMDIRL